MQGIPSTVPAAKDWLSDRKDRRVMAVGTFVTPIATEVLFSRDWRLLIVFR